MQIIALLLVFGGLTEDQAALATLPPPDSAAVFTARVEARSERFDYRFDNDSNFDPGPLVPHFFEQRYDASNTWVALTARYRLAGLALSTEGGWTPRITTSGSDIDTFFQPSGDVVTSGTDGDVRLRSFAIQQRLDLSSWRRWQFGVIVGYRRSRMDFLPSDRIITHTQPPSTIRQPVPGHETTWSNVIASGFTASAPFALGERWRMTVVADLLPVTRARLSVSLPDKYPGQIVRADAFSLGLAARVEVERRISRIGVGGGLNMGGAWGYRETAGFHNRHIGGAIVVRVPL